MKSKSLSITTVLLFLFSFNGTLMAQQCFAESSSSHSLEYPIGWDYPNDISLWSNPNTWSCGEVPNDEMDVVIPPETAVLLNTSVTVKSIRIEGQLIVDLSQMDLAVETEYIMVTGSGSLFEWGTEDTPYLGYGTITLSGTDPTAMIPGTNPPVDSKAIMAMSNGVIHIHGKEKVSWTQIAESTDEGADQIVLEEINTGWQIGDEFVLASSEAYIFNNNNFNNDDGILEQSEL